MIDKILIILIVYIFFINKKNFSNVRYPNGPLILPIIGSLYSIDIKFPHLSFKKLSKKYGNVFSLKMGSIETIVINDIDFLQKTFRDNPTCFSQRFQFNSFNYLGNKKDVIFGNGLHWKKIRGILSSSITKSKSRLMEDLFNEEYYKAEIYIKKKILENEIINMSPIIKRILLNILYKFLFGISFEYDDSLLSQEFYDFINNYNKIFELLSNQPADFIPILKPFNTYSQLDKLYKDILKFFQPSIDSLYKNLDKENPKCFLEYFIVEIEKDTSGCVSLDCIPNICFDIIVAGMDTTSTTMEWMLLFLSNYQEIQNKLYDEINVPYNPTTKEKSKFPFLNATIKETLRFSPPAPFALSHICTEDIIVDNIFIPKNTQIIPNLYGCNRNEKDFIEPDVFNPNRFFSLPPVSFSLGLRSCPGENIADAIMFLVSTKLYKTFKFERISNELYDEKGYLTKTLTPCEFFSKVSLRE